MRPSGPGAAALAASPTAVWVAAPSLFAWTVFVVAQVTPGLGLTQLCASPETPIGVAWQARLATAFAGLDPLGWATASVLMVLAMMLPLAAPMVGYVAQRSFAERRGRAIGTFLTGFGLVWLLVLVATSVVLLAVLALLPPQLSRWALPTLCVAAAAWQVSMAKVRAVNRCHGVMALRARGWSADQDALRFGLIHGGRCVRACLPAMAPLLMMPHGVLAMAAMTGVLLAERARPRPQYRLSALVLLLLPLTTV